VLQDCGKLVTVISGNSMPQSLLMAGDDDEVFDDKKPRRYAKDKRTAFNCM